MMLLLDVVNIRSNWGEVQIIAIMNNKKNAISSVLLQIATIVQGLILPRLILSVFGSDVNGLVSSVTQFLSFITLLEGGLGAVVLAELYEPIEKRNDKSVFQIMEACQSFFTKLTIVFVLYTLAVAIIYPIYLAKDFSFEYVSSLVFVLSLVTAAQYLFSISYRLLLQAEQKLYIVNLVSAVTIIINTLTAIMIVFLFPSVHIVKLCSGIIYMLQPLVYRQFVEKKFWVSPRASLRTEMILKNRWNGFSQNLAHFINMNTDIALITIFMSLQSVSVYTIHMLPIVALRGLIVSLGNSYQSALGKYIVVGDKERLQAGFGKFERLFWMFGTAAFMTCLLLLNSFVKIYTQGISDTNYYQPVFTFVITLANMLFVVREPYRLLVLAAGKFRETNLGSVAEAVINITLSVALIIPFKLVGVAIGTLVAMAFRMIYLMWYLHQDIIKRKTTDYLPYIETLFVIVGINASAYHYLPLSISGFIEFCFIGVAILLFELLLYEITYSTIRTIYNFLKVSR